MSESLNETSYDIPSHMEPFADELIENMDPDKNSPVFFPHDDEILESQNTSQTNMQSAFESIIILNQPCPPPRLRYRNDYSDPPKRKGRDPLTGKDPNSAYKGPAIRIPLQYCQSSFYVGISLATVLHEPTQCFYVHSYTIEDIDNKDRNDTNNNIVWYPMVNNTNGVFSFPDLRIVRKNEAELLSAGGLRLLPGFTLDSNLLISTVPKQCTKREIVPEYNLKKGRLTFFIGQKQHDDDPFPTPTVLEIRVFSEEMILVTDETTSETNKASDSNVTSSPSDCSISKYAPRYGFTEGGEEMLIMCTKNVNKKNFGNVQIKLESVTPEVPWSHEVVAEAIEVSGNIISFRIPRLPSSIDRSLHVKITVQQKKRFLGSLDYRYIKQNKCPACQLNANSLPTVSNRSNSNKRIRVISQTDSFEYDALVPVAASESTPIFRQSKSEPASILSNSNSNTSLNTNQTDASWCQRVEDNIQQLFLDNDFKPLLRTCRLFIKRRPDLFHHAIEENYSQLISSFATVAGDKLLQEKNELGETPLLHGVRLNQIDFIKALLQRKNADKLFNETNQLGQNIFHILAMNKDANELFNIIIDYLLKNSIDIGERFDDVDNDNHTPLQIAILNDNLSAIRLLWKYSNKEILQTSENLGENLVHFTVRHGNLTTLKYLLEKGELIDQENRTSLTMTPFELAKSLNRNDMVEYLEQIYPQPKVEFEEETSDND